LGITTWELVLTQGNTLRSILANVLVAGITLERYHNSWKP